VERLDAAVPQRAAFRRVMTAQVCALVRGVQRGVT